LKILEDLFLPGFSKYIDKKFNLMKIIKLMFNYQVLTLFLLSIVFIFNTSVFGQGVSINATNAPPNPSAMLDVQSTDKGMLVPRVTQAQRNAIPNPATSLLIYQSDGQTGFYYNAGTPAAPNWQLVGSNAGTFSQWTTNGNVIHYNDGDVGIGTANPIARLSVDAGINLDQSNLNGVSLVHGLTFGSDKLVGIASNRSGAGNTQNGMNFYTNGTRRLSIADNGWVGIGVSNPLYLLHVSGDTRIDWNLYVANRLGIGVGNPDYALHTSVGYFTTRIGIGTTPNSTYALDVAGNSRFQNNLRVAGTVTSEGNVVVQNNRGIVRSNSSTQYKIVPFTLTFSINAGPGGNFVTGNISYGETFSSPPSVIVGQITHATGTAGTPAWLNIVPAFSTNSSVQFYIANVGSGTLNLSTVTVACIAIGPQ